MEPGKGTPFVPLPKRVDTMSKQEMDNVFREITELINESGEQAGDVLAMTKSLGLAVAASICGITLLYQGGLAYYYWKKTRDRR